MNIIDTLKKSKSHMIDLQLKEASFGLGKIYIVNIQTVSSSELSNHYVLDYIAKRSLIKNDILSLKSDMKNYISSISFIEIK